MVTGAYHPEISSGGLQSQLMAGAIGGRAEIRVLTTARDPATPRHGVIDGVAVTRVHVRVTSLRSKLGAARVMLRELWRLVRWCDVIHIHGVSTKNVLVTAMAKLVGRPIVLSLHTMGADEPEPVRRTGALAWWAFRSASRYLGVSPVLTRSALAAGLPSDAVELVPNGIDTGRFLPASAAERRALRRAAGHDDAIPLILFVGFFSHDKQPRVLFDAWRRLFDDHHIDAAVWFVGATKSDYFEIDGSLADLMRADAAASGRAERVVFTGQVHDVHRYFRLADVFVLPSRREGLPVALMEAMSCALPCVASRLPGATDTLIEDGVSGVLVPPGDVPAVTAALAALLIDPARASALGAAARQVVLDRFANEQIAERWLRSYETVLAGGRDFRLR